MPAWQIDNLANDRGCQNCGKPARALMGGFRCCGASSCKASLKTVWDSLHKKYTPGETGYTEQESLRSEG